MKNIQNILKDKFETRTTKRKKRFVIIVLVILFAIIISILLWGGKDSQKGEWICEKGEWVMQGKTKDPKPETACESETAQGQSESGRVKPDKEIEEINSQRTAEGINIRVMSPYVNQTITSPLTITGEAKGWYSEASFPVKLIDEKGVVLGSGEAKAEGDGGDDEYISFTAEIEFDTQGAKAGDLVFQKSNPSGAPETAGTFSFPVFFE